MTERVFHHSWSGMKGAFKPRRKWMTWGEFQESLGIYGIQVPRYVVRQALAADPPAKVNNGYRYEMKHIEMVREFVSRGPSMTEQQKRDAITSQEEAVTRIGQVCEAFKSGHLSYGQALKQIEDVIDESTRIVRVGTETHTPEVQS
jgi:hypothetical protein